MPIIFNLSGLGIAVVAFAAGVGLYQFAALSLPSREVVEWSAGLAGFAVVAATLDLFYRRQKRESGKVPLWNPERGGSVMFLPLWFHGALAAAGAIYFVVSCPESQRDVIIRYQTAVGAKTAELSAALALLDTVGGSPPQPASVSLDPKPFVDRPADRANVAFYIPGIRDSDEDVNGRHSEDLFYAAAWFGVGGYGGKSTLYNIRSCAGDLAESAEAALAIRYVVARRGKESQLFYLIDLQPARVVAAFFSKPDPDSMRESLTKLTGGTFVFRTPA